MIQTIKKFVFAFLKYGSPLLLLSMLTLSVYGALAPWPPIENELAKHPDSIAILSGVSAHYMGDYEKVTKTYLLLHPKNLESYSLRLTVDSEGFHELNKEKGGFISMATTYGFLLFCTYWFWLRRAHNKSGLRTR